MIPLVTNFYLSLAVSSVVAISSNIGAGTMLGMIPTLYDESIRGLATALIFGTLRIPGLISPILTSTMLQLYGSFYVMCLYSFLGVISTILILNVKIS